MKKRYILYFIILSLFFACEEDKMNMEPSANEDNATKSSNLLTSDAPNIVKGVIKIKLNRNVGDDISFAAKDGIVQSNVTPLNTLLGNIKATEMRRLFPYAGKFEERTRREGLHLWYVVNFDPKVLVSNAIAEANKVKDIQIVEEQFEIKVPDYTPIEETGAVPTEANPPVDDPKLGRQWHYNNDGKISGSVKGADINLFKAWGVEVGKRNVIVDVVDGGVDYAHEDLKDNMYVNEAEKNGEAGKDDDGNGYVDDIYGYNFVTNKGEIAPQPHGTHVAGTIAARNNNGIGVCGVAGGDGTPESGVRIMSSQIFLGNRGGDAESALKYGADNGAVISQNSWGYPASSGVRTISSSLKEAIDYFIKYAGCDNDGNQLADSPMKGGVVIFAAGNDDQEFTATPAYYEPVVSVTSMGPDLKKAYYSTYGTWADIMAPGGNSNFSGGEIYSTLPNNRYGYMQGTSMACPHVSGIAALIVSKFGGEGFTNEDLKKHLLTGLRPFNIDENNPKYAGKLGAGYIDAYAVLAEEKDNKAPDTPKITKLTPDFTSLNVEWEAVADANDVSPIAYMLYYSEQKLDEGNYKSVDKVKVNGFGYEVGKPISYLLEELPLNTKFYLAIEAVDRWDATSGVSFAEGKTKENHPPVITREDNSPIRLKEDEIATLKLKVSDPDEGQEWKYSVTGHTEGVTINKTEDGLSLKFRVEKPFGKYTLKVVVTDVFGATSEIEIPFEYYKNEPPVVSKEFEKLYAPVNKAYTIDLNKHFTDPEGAKMTFTAKSLTADAVSVKVDGNVLSITPTKLGMGSVEVTAKDVEGEVVTTQLNLQGVKDDIVYVIYPVPVRKMLNVRLANDVNQANLSVRTTTGAVVLEKAVSVNEGNRLVVLNLSDLPGGTYVLHAEANGKKFKQTFVKY